MTYTNLVLEAERISLLEGEDRSDVLAWLTSPHAGVIEPDWDDE